MDRRRLQSKNVLQSRLFSASQLAAKNAADSMKNDMKRSVSAIETKSSSRKRKNSNVEDKDSSEESSSKITNRRKKRHSKIYNSHEEKEMEEEVSSEESSSKITNRRKKRRSKIYDSHEEEEIIEEASSGESSPKITNKRKKRGSKIYDSHKEKEIIEEASSGESSPKITNTRKKRSSKIYDSHKEKEMIEETSPGRTSKSKNKKKKTERFSKQNVSKESDSDKDEENEEINSTTSGSSIRGFLQALDKSPSKLSQSSNTSFTRLRNRNLRTPVNSKIQQSASKNIVEKRKEISTPQKDDESMNDVDTEKFDLENILSGQLSKNKSDLNKSVNSDNSKIQSQRSQLSFNASNSSIKKNNTQPKNESPRNLRTISKDKTQDKVFTSPVSNYRNKRKKSLDFSPFKINQDNDLNNVNIQKQISVEADEKLVNFLNKAGITLYPGEILHVANDNSIEVIQKMKQLLSSNTFQTDEIIQSWNNYINDEENLKKSLLEIKIETDEGTELSSKALSLSRFFLQVPELQVPIFHSLFKKLIDAVITSESSDEAPWALLMLQQFRFLEIIVDSDFLIVQIEELLSKSPEWFQCEIIVFIPDIVTDSHHYQTAEMLIKIMKNNSDLTNAILDCIQNLILTKDYKEELREQILKLLENNVEKNILPAITRFIFDECATEEIALKCLNAIREIDITTSSKKEMNECYTNQMFIINAIKMNIQQSKQLSQAALTFIKTCNSEALPLDIIILILLYENVTTKKKILESSFLCHIKEGYYKISLLDKLYTAYKEVAKSLQPTALNLAINLLKANSSIHVEFGIEWIRNIFISQCDTSYKQRKILEKLLNLMGNKDKTVKNALEVLSRMVNNESECKNFEHHAGFLRLFVDKIDNLQFDEVALLYHILHGFCTQSELISNVLNDDLNIIMQKQLNSSKPLTKCKGVLGAVMAIKHLAKNNETSDEAFTLLNKTLKVVKNCVRSKTLFFDQLGKVFSNSSMDEKFLTEAITYFEEIFVSTCLVETNSDEELVPKFGLNDPAMTESYYVDFGKGKTGTLVSAFFKLLCIFNMRSTGSLESINAVLGCPILMPEDLDMPEPLVADYLIHCINWFREIIGGFVTQEERLLREQVIKRLQSLMTLQGEFVTMVSMCGIIYEPPPCYFHYYPIPKFIRIDAKSGKKKNKKIIKKKKKKEDVEEDKKEDETTDSTLNKSVLLPEWKSWVVGSQMTIKNPAFFRQMDIKILHLLETDIDAESSDKITIAQVCFIVKEVLGMFQNQMSERLIEHSIKLLPKVCDKFKKIIIDLRQRESVHEKEAVQLILCLLTNIFMWKEFKNAKYNILLRDGLRILAGMMNESNITLRSCKDLVAEAYTYFESLADIATEISTAVALVNICNCLMNHSTSFMEQSKERQAKMAFGFLSLEWNTETNKSEYKIAIRDLLKMWLDNEPDPLETVNSIMEWLPEEVKSFDSPKSRLSRLAAINKMNFSFLVKQLFIGLIKGVDVSLNSVETDPQRIQIWLTVAKCLEKLADICKMSRNNIYLILFIRYMALLYQLILSSGMKILEMNVKYQTEEVLSVIKLFQKAGRVLRDIFCTARRDNNLSLLKLIPIVKSRREKFIFRVKGMLTANNSIGAFWMGNLLNKDLDGEEIITESPEDLTTASDITNDLNNTDDIESEIFNSDSGEDSDNDE